jgi:hypothetical protein
LREVRLAAASDYIGSLGLSCEAAAVIGSTARGWFEDGSDIDILCFGVPGDLPTSGGAGGWTINLIPLDLRETAGFLRAWDASLAQLRLASNLEFCVPLVGAGRLEELRRANLRMRLAPPTAAFYGNLGCEALEAMRTAETMSDVLVQTNAALQSLLLLVLAASPLRIIKPKWTMRCIASVDESLCRAIADLLGPDQLGPWIDDDLVRRAGKNLMADGDHVGSVLFRQWAAALEWDWGQRLAPPFLALCLVARGASRGCIRLDAAPHRKNVLQAAVTSIFSRAAEVLNRLSPREG